MKDPNIKTKIVHSLKNSAWNVIGTSAGGKFKVARCPYVVSGNDKIDQIDRIEAYNHAEFISYCFNKSNEILLNP